jgi:signal peptidase I
LPSSSLEPKLNIRTLRDLWQQTGEQHWLPVQGTSMLPHLHEGDELLISHDLSAVRRGDILVFQRPDGLVAHRVVWISQQPGGACSYRTKGDNRRDFDPPLEDEVILGRATAVRRNGQEHSLTTPARRLWNRTLGAAHLTLGTLFQILRPVWHALRKKQP